jgi:hypothetical protein
MREARWRDAADDGCLDIGQAREHALTEQAELDGNWPVFETARDPEDPTHAGLCLDVQLRLEGLQRDQLSRNRDTSRTAWGARGRHRHCAAQLTSRRVELSLTSATLA